MNSVRVNRFAEKKIKQGICVLDGADFPELSLTNTEKPSVASVALDLHGLRADEAIEKLDKFISDSLVMGFDEVSVFHGIGTGKLAWAVKNFLKEHPSVKEFFDAPPSQGGFGAKIIRL